MKVSVKNTARILKNWLVPVRVRSKSLASIWEISDVYILLLFNRSLDREIIPGRRWLITIFYVNCLEKHHPSGVLRYRGGKLINLVTGSHSVME